MQHRIKANLWKSIENHAHSYPLCTPKYLIQSTSTTQQLFNASACNLHIDYTNQHISTETLELLFSLADTCCLQDKIHALTHGDIVNISERKPALHTALRAKSEIPVMVNHQNVMPEIIATRNKMQMIVEQIRAKLWFGFSGKPISDIVNIGIGGSDLGPRFALKALGNLTSKEIRCHFISDADPMSFENAISELSPETTLFIVSSKSFTTQETLYNARKAMDWIGTHPHREKHFIAVTADFKKANQFGINTVLPIWDWIGGRYSFCSAINLITAIAIGFDQFSQILAGAHSMDLHFQENDFATNLPVLLALIGIWNNNFLHIHNLLILTYTQSLEKFVPYVQQLDMESNGKSIDNQGKAVNHATGPLVWGGLGNQAQHSYYQLLCQGTHKITADFISLNSFSGEIINNMCDAKIGVLTAGITSKDNQNGYIPGNMPLNHIRIDNYSPFTIGALVALYEHKVFTQSVIWNINPFDQPGVESAKNTRHRQTESKIAVMPE